jgi:hypothetical protein
MTSVFFMADLPLQVKVTVPRGFAAAGVTDITEGRFRRRAKPSKYRSGAGLLPEACHERG